jgi:peptide deformylase
MPEHQIDALIAELKHWRDVRGLSQSSLARQTGYTPSYVSKVEGGQLPPSGSFARQADDILRAGGAIRRAFRDLEGQDRATHSQAPGGDDSHATSLIVEHEDTTLHYDGRQYRAVQRRRLYNDSPDPVTRYLIRISVDRYPGSPERSNQHYREHPLTWDEIQLGASLDGEPLTWRVKHDRDAFKELWLLFENEHGQYPLYPGDAAWLEYGYTVGDDKWGSWFQRAVRLPTRRMSVRLDFPAALNPAVWGTETTMTAEAMPFRTAISRTDENGRRIYSWSTDDPPLHARYRLEWKFRNHQEEHLPVTESDATASERMQAVGIIQEGDPILSKTARPFVLPSEAEDARRVVAELVSVAERASQVHVFGKGMGVAAPQIGIDRAAAIVRTPDGELVTLFNPRIVEESGEADEQYEGCLSFFDVRGKVPRPLAISVEHQDIDGTERITIFEQGMARLVAHEVDHLHGLLYRARMREGVNPIPVSEYRGTGSGWSYGQGAK